MEVHENVRHNVFQDISDGIHHILTNSTRNQVNTSPEIQSLFDDYNAAANLLFEFSRSSKHDGEKFHSPTMTLDTEMTDRTQPNLDTLSIQTPSIGLFEEKRTLPGPVKIQDVMKYIQAYGDHAEHEQEANSISVPTSLQYVDSEDHNSEIRSKKEAEPKNKYPTYTEIDPEQEQMKCDDRSQTSAIQDKEFQRILKKIETTINHFDQQSQRPEANNSTIFDGSSDKESSDVTAALTNKLRRLYLGYMTTYIRLILCMFSNVYTSSCFSSTNQQWNSISVPTSLQYVDSEDYNSEIGSKKDAEPKNKSPNYTEIDPEQEQMQCDDRSQTSAIQDKEFHGMLNEIETIINRFDQQYQSPEAINSTILDGSGDKESISSDVTTALTNKLRRLYYDYLTTYNKLISSMFSNTYTSSCFSSTNQQCNNNNISLASDCTTESQASADNNFVDHSSTEKFGETPPKEANITTKNGTTVISARKSRVSKRGKRPKSLIKIAIKNATKSRQLSELTAAAHISKHEVKLKNNQAISNSNGIRNEEPDEPQPEGNWVEDHNREIRSKKDAESKNKSPNYTEIEPEQEQMQCDDRSQTSVIQDKEFHGILNEIETIINRFDQQSRSPEPNNSTIFDMVIFENAALTNEFRRLLYGYMTSYVELMRFMSSNTYTSSSASSCFSSINQQCNNNNISQASDCTTEPQASADDNLVGHSSTEVFDETPPTETNNKRAHISKHEVKNNQTISNSNGIQNDEPQQEENWVEYEPLTEQETQNVVNSSETVARDVVANTIAAFTSATPSTLDPSSMPVLSSNDTFLRLFYDYMPSYIELIRTASSYFSSTNQQWNNNNIPQASDCTTESQASADDNLIGHSSTEVFDETPPTEAIITAGKGTTVISTRKSKVSKRGKRAKSLIKIAIKNATKSRQLSKLTAAAQISKKHEVKLKNNQAISNSNGIQNEEPEEPQPEENWVECVPRKLDFTMQKTPKRWSKYLRNKSTKRRRS